MTVGSGLGFEYRSGDNESRPFDWEYVSDGTASLFFVMSVEDIDRHLEETEGGPILLRGKNGRNYEVRRKS